MLKEVCWMDKGKVSALQKAGWSEDEIAKEMQVSIEDVRRAVSQNAEKEMKPPKSAPEVVEEKRLVCLSKEDLQELLEKAADIGAKAGIDKYVEELKSFQRKKADRRLYNTKLLLRNYRMLEAHAENSVFGRNQMRETAADILESMMNMYNDELVVESIKNSATRTAIIVSHIKAMLEIFQICCERSTNELDKRRYDIVYGLYIAEDKISRKDLADKWNVSRDTTYTDEKIAIERLSALFFGADGLQLQ